MYALTCYGIKFGWETLRCCCSIETWVCNNTKEIKYLDLKKKKNKIKQPKQHFLVLPINTHTLRIWNAKDFKFVAIILYTSVAFTRIS